MGLEGVDEEILQDFLIEASEIIESLSEQLVELEKRPNDDALLNSIFRGFHTVKGGAGFLSLTNLVTACHGAENVFDTLRKGERQVDAELMDVILRAHDVITTMFGQVQAHEDPEEAPPELLHELAELSKPQAAGAAEKPAAPPPPPPPPPPVKEEKVAPVSTGADIDNITDDEFEALLDSLHGKGVAPGQAAGASSKAQADSTDDDFDAILKGAEAKPVQIPLPSNGPAPVAPAPKVAAPSASDSGDMTDDEFEALLDSLHGKGVAPGSGQETVDTPSTVVESPKVASTPAQSSPAPSPVATSAPSSVAEAPKPVAKPVAKSSNNAPSTPVADTTVRVDTKTLDVIMNMVGELVLVRNRLISLGNVVGDEELTKAVSNLDVVTADLQGAVMKTRMQPIKKVFGRFPRVVRDLARNLSKKIELVMEGEETDLDKNLVDALADPMVHLVRNSCDHGIETPDIRKAAGKPEVGTIVLSASQQGDHILLKIIDDGAGMDPEKLKNIAISKGLIDEDAAARMPDSEAFNLIFAPGFSTKKEISDISGRGVGMDVVKTNITKLNGSLRIDSQLGVGSTIEIRVPLTLAILPTLMIKVGGQVFSLPLTSVNEIFYLELNNVRVVDGQSTVIIREKAIPLFYLQDWLVRDKSKIGKRSAWGHVVLVQHGDGQQVAFVVDELIGQEEVVIKPLDNLLHGTPGMAGATITSDGGISLIIDIPGLLRTYAKKYTNTNAGSRYKSYESKRNQ